MAPPPSSFCPTSNPGTRKEGISFLSHVRETKAPSSKPLSPVFCSVKGEAETEAPGVRTPQQRCLYTATGLTARCLPGDPQWHVTLERAPAPATVPRCHGLPVTCWVLPPTALLFSSLGQPSIWPSRVPGYISVTQAHMLARVWPL